MQPADCWSSTHTTVVAVFSHQKRAEYESSVTKASQPLLTPSTRFRCAHSSSNNKWPHSHTHSYYTLTASRYGIGLSSCRNPVWSIKKNRTTTKILSNFETSRHKIHGKHETPLPPPWWATVTHSTAGSQSRMRFWMIKNFRPKNDMSQASVSQAPPQDRNPCLRKPVLSPINQPKWHKLKSNIVVVQVPRHISSTRKNA